MTTAVKPNYARKAKIVGMIAAAREAGMKVGGFEADPDGTIRILTERSAPAANDAYDRWSAKKAR